MTRSLHAGGTDYTHQSLKEMIIDLQNWIKSLEDSKKTILKDIEQLKERSYWGKVYSGFKNFIQHCLSFFETALDEIKEILLEIDNEILPHHVSRIENLGSVAGDLNIKIGSLWNSEYPRELLDYDADEFWYV